MSAPQLCPAEPLRSVRHHLSEVVDRVEHQHERVIITRNGRDAAVAISPADLAELLPPPARRVLTDRSPARCHCGDRLPHHPGGATTTCR